MNQKLHYSAAALLALALSPAFAAAPTCTLTPTPSSVAPAGSALVRHTAHCTGAASVRFYDGDGDILIDREAPFEVTLGYSDANRTGSPRVYKLHAEACSADVPAQCVTMSDTITQAPMGSISAPSCTARANPTSFAAAGGNITLFATCTGSAVGSWKWTLNGALIGESATVARGVLANPSAQARSFTFELTACAAEDVRACGTASVTVSQAGVQETPVTAPSCTAKASPANLPQSGGIVSLSATCSGSAVGSFSWKRGAETVGQAQNASVSVGANPGASRVIGFTLTACAAQDGSKCSSAGASVHQDGVAQPPSPPSPPSPPTVPPSEPSPPATSCPGSAPVQTRSVRCPTGYTGSQLQQMAYVCTAGAWTASDTWQTLQSTCVAQAGFPMAPVAAVEFYHAGLDHYFVSANPDEIHGLDTGYFAGWTRTGHSFEVLPAAAAPANGSVPVCRYYGNPAAGLASHFYSANAQECLMVAVRWPESWLLESANVFQVLLVHGLTGGCPAGSKPVYRFFNNRRDANHRYVVDETVRAWMANVGWVPEGPVFCSVK